MQAAAFVDHHCHSLIETWAKADAGPWPSWRRCFTESTSERVLARDVTDLLGYRHFLGALGGLAGAESSSERDVVAARDELAGADPETYLRRLMDDAGIEALLVDTGYGGPGTLLPGDLEREADRTVREIVRIESVAEELLAMGGPATDTLNGLVDAFEGRIVEAIEGGAVALKSVLAYRAGLHVESIGVGELRAAFERLDLAAQGRRFDDPVLGPFLARRAAEVAGLWSVPLQFHTGFGDEDIRLPSADPTMLRPLLHDPRTEACPIVLLHCYPFVGGAAAMAGAYPQVYLDLSLAIPLAEPLAADLVREALGLCPAGKLLAASDGHTFPEMHWWGATVWRRALATVLAAEVERGDLDDAAVADLTSRILGGNAARLYGVDPRRGGSEGPSDAEDGSSDAADQGGTNL
jgi:predicted TIM-barrel fold metal-dependent hydrolase